MSVLSVAVCLLGIAGFAYATIPDSGGEQGSSKAGDDHVLTAKTLVLTDGQRKKLLEHGPFKLVGVCDLDARPGADVVEMIIRTAQDHSAFSRTSQAGGDPDWLSSEPPIEVLGFGAAADSPELSAGQPFTAIAPDRTTILTGLPWAGVNVLGRTDRCRFGGHFFTE